MILTNFPVRIDPSLVRLPALQKALQIKPKWQDDKMAVDGRNR
jgi:hypothetical protein